MKFNNLTQEGLNGLFDVINKECKGQVYLVGDDIRLNMKSKIAQLISLANIFSGDNDIEELEIQADNKEDTAKLVDYMLKSAKII